jgi:HD superfamily phosphohydrolase
MALRYQKAFRDAVNNRDLRFTDIELKVINTRPFQRLRGLKQLGTTDLVYPSATHTRFSHSLGTCNVARDIIESINDKSPEGAVVSTEDEQEICLAALLHDILNLPYGHIIEDESPIFPVGELKKHDSEEVLTEFFSEKTNPLASILRSYRGDIGPALAKLISAKDDDLGGGRAKGKEPRKEQKTFPLGADIVGNTICADLLDYLARDTFSTGLCDRYDYDRIVSAFELYTPTGLSPRLVMRLEADKSIRRGLLSEILKLLNIRYTLAERVYYHPTKIMAGTMLARAVLAGLRSGKIVLNDPGAPLRSLQHLTDEALLFLLEADDTQIVTDSDEAQVEAQVARMLVAKLRCRDIYRPAWSIDHQTATADGEAFKESLIATYHDDPEKRSEAESFIARSAGLPVGSVLIYCPPASMSQKEAAVRVIWPGYADGEQLQRINDPLVQAEMRALQSKHPNLWRMFVLLDQDYVDKKQRIYGICAEIFTPDAHLKHTLSEHRVMTRIVERGHGGLVSYVLETAGREGLPKTPAELDALIDSVASTLEATQDDGNADGEGGIESDQKDIFPKNRHAKKRVN